MKQSEFNAWVMGRFYNDFSFGWTEDLPGNPINVAFNDGLSTALLDYSLANPLGIYHKGCMDGTAAAAALQTALPGIPLHACQYGDTLPVRGYPSSYIFVDFSPTPDQLDTLLAKGHRVLVVDHHETARVNLGRYRTRDNFYLYFDATRSGAALAWDLFLRYVPRLVEFIEDRDLWRWEIPGSRAVSAYLQTLQLYDKPEEFLAVLDKFDEGVVRARGELLLLQQDAYIAQAVKRRRDITLHGKRVSVVFSCLLQSEIGNELSKTADAGLVISGMEGDSFIASFRSVDDRSAIELATAYGGGGHPNAAGCRLPIGDLK